MATTTESRARMLKEAKAALGAAELVYRGRFSRADQAVGKALSGLAELHEHWQRGEVTLQQARMALIKAHNDIMRAPSSFSVEAAQRRADSARAVVTMLEKEEPADA